MPKAIRFICRAVPVSFWILAGLLAVTLILPWSPPDRRRRWTHAWSQWLMRLCGVNVTVSGAPRQDGAVLWVANHVSWLDIFALNAVRPTIFVAKSDIRRWPLIGTLVEGAGTVFIERGNRQAVRAVGDQMKARFDQGDVVGLFPEGTTSSGFDVAPFHASLFDAAIRSGVDVQPVALCFRVGGRRSELPAFVGDQTLVANLWVVLGTAGVSVELTFLPLLSGDECEGMGRSAIAERTREAIRSVVSVPAAAQQGGDDLAA